MSHKIFDNNLVAICKSKLALKFNKPAYIEMCKLDFREVLMYKFHYEYNNSKNFELVNWTYTLYGFSKMCFADRE